MTIKLTTTPCYNPYTVQVKDGEYREVKEIKIFNERGICYKFRWFSKGGIITSSVPIEFEGLELVRKGKEDFKKMYLQGKAFWIPKSKESHERHYTNNFCILYLPINRIDLKEVSRKKTTFENSHQTWDDVLYSVMGDAGFFSENQNYRKSVQNKKNEAIDKLVNESQFKSISYEITRNYGELKKLMDEIQIIKEGKA